MFGRKPELTALEVRKRLLIAESELNRAGLREDWTALQAETQRLVEKGRSVFSMVSTVAVAAASFSALRRIWCGGQNGKTSWLSKLLEAARVGASLWVASHSRGP